MAMSIRFEWLDEGFAQIIDSPEVNSIVTQATRRIADVAGDGFNAKPARTSRLKHNRDIGIVAADTYAAKRAEATDKVLSKAVQQCRIS